MISRLLFENALLAIVCWAPLQLILMIHWSRTRTQTSTRVFWIGAALLPLLLVLQAVVTTQREELIAYCESLASYAEAGDVMAISRSLDTNFLAGSLDKEGFVDRTKSTLTRFDITDARVRDFDIAFDDDGVATVEVTASGLVPSSSYLDRIMARLKLTVTKRGERWFMTKLEVLPSQLSPIQSMNELLR